MMWILVDAFELGYEYTCSISGKGIITPIKDCVPKNCQDCPCRYKCHK